MLNIYVQVKSKFLNYQFRIDCLYRVICFQVDEYFGGAQPHMPIQISMAGCLTVSLHLKNSTNVHQFLGNDKKAIKVFLNLSILASNSEEQRLTESQKERKNTKHSSSLGL